MCTHTSVSNLGGCGAPDKYVCNDCCRDVVPKRRGGFKLKPEIGETHSKYEPWTCGCGARFDLAATWFDPNDGIVCPKCKSKDCGPVGSVQ